MYSDNFHRISNKKVKKGFANFIIEKFVTTEDDELANTISDHLLKMDKNLKLQPGEIKKIQKTC
jgi:hypothetical protein